MSAGDPPKRPPPPRVPTMNRQVRRAGKRERLKLLPGGKPLDAPKANMSTPAGRFAFALHSFLVNYRTKNPDVPPAEFCAAALQVAAKLGLEVGTSNAEEFGKAAETFFEGEVAARQRQT